MNAAASSWRVRTKRIELSRRESISSRFSSPGIPKANRTCSFSRQVTRKAAAFIPPGWPTRRFIECGHPETAGLAEKDGAGLRARFDVARVGEMAQHPCDDARGAAPCSSSGLLYA